MRRALLVMAAAALMAAMLVVMAVPAFASPQHTTGPQGNNPNYYTAPVPSPYHYQGGGCVNTFSAPPSQGGTAPGSSAAGGSPGYVSNYHKPSECNGSSNF